MKLMSPELSAEILKEIIYGRNTDAVFSKKRNNGFIMLDIVIARYEIFEKSP